MNSHTAQVRDEEHAVPEPATGPAVSTAGTAVAPPLADPRGVASRRREDDAVAKARPVFMSRTRPPGWTLGAPKRPGRYWYAASRGLPARLVTVEWQEPGSEGEEPELVFYAEGEPKRPTRLSLGWWQI